MKKLRTDSSAFTDREIYPALWITVGALLIAAALWLLAGKPTISVCWFYSNYHVYCPGCGCTRSLIALVRGDILYALYCNPAVPYTAGLILAYLVTQTVWRLRGRRGWVLQYAGWWFPGLFMILAINCILRNVLWWCFAIPL